MIKGINNVTEIFLRVGLVFLISGIFIGLIFGEWTVMLIVGIILTIPPVIESGILGVKHYMSQEEVEV